MERKRIMTIENERTTVSSLRCAARAAAGKLAVIAILVAPCLFIEACSCSCTPRAERSAGRSAPRDQLKTPSTITAERFSGAFAAYLAELRVNEAQSRLKTLKQISIDQKQTAVAFSRGSGDKNSLLDDPTGKFKELEPLVKENKIDEIIAALHRIARENAGDRQVELEASRKLSLCYYIVGDHIKCSGYMAKYNALLEEEVRREDEINEKALKNLKNEIDY